VVSKSASNKPITKQALEKGRVLQQVSDLMLFVQRWTERIGEENELGETDRVEEDFSRLDIAKNRHGGQYSKFDLQMVPVLKISNEKASKRWMKLS